jgi:hypothetical protein
MGWKSSAWVWLLLAAVLLIAIVLIPLMQRPPGWTPRFH